LLRTLLDLIGFGFGGVLVLANSLEPECRGNELDLIEVESLVHRHHQAQFLEGKLNDLGGGNLHGGGELRDGDELVDADQRFLALLLLCQPACLHRLE
jgi:hypothetical protein